MLDELAFLSINNVLQGLQFLKSIMPQETCNIWLNFWSQHAQVEETLHDET